MATTDRQHRLNAGADDGRDGDIDLIRAAPVLARLAFAAWLRTTGWTLQASLSASSRVVRGAARGESPTEILGDVGDELRDFLRKLLGVESASNGDGPSGSGGSAGSGPAASNGSGHNDAEPVDAEVVEDDRMTVDRLQEQARELLRRSANVYDDDEVHPAYTRILQDLAPDEARILRFLCREGPQPSVDVRTAGPLALARSELVAPGLNMIGIGAGIKHPERIKSYLNNLYRLGLIWFSQEPLEDPLEYQVLEAQPEVSEAMEKAGRGKTVRRSIHLTDFGDDFCTLVLPDDTDELRAIQAERPSDKKSRKRDD